jgi:hypothetical protein
MEPGSAARPTLPASRSFVIQLHSEADIGNDRVIGRVEHVVSGQATHFETLADLLHFMAATLSEDRCA